MNTLKRATDLGSVMRQNFKAQGTPRKPCPKEHSKLGCSALNVNGSKFEQNPWGSGSTGDGQHAQFVRRTLRNTAANQGHLIRATPPSQVCTPSSETLSR